MPSSMRPRAFLRLCSPFALAPSCLVPSRLTLLCLATLSACGGEDLPAFAPACPQTGILRDGADLTVFRGSGTDLTDMVADGRITGLSGKCSLDDRAHLRTIISVNLEIARGPAATARDGDVTYFVSVSRNGLILDKRDYTLHVTYPRNSDRLRLTGDQVDLVLPLDDKTKGSDYNVLIGFQLTPQQLAFNRRRGPR